MSLYKKNIVKNFILLDYQAFIPNPPSTPASSRPLFVEPTKPMPCIYVNGKSCAQWEVQAGLPTQLT